MVNWDDVLGYQTVKFVRVRDRKLGALYYFFSFMILTYIVGYVILINKRYMMFEAPTGMARLGVMAPSADLVEPVGNLSYCTGGTPLPGQLPNGGKDTKKLSYDCEYR